MLYNEKVTAIQLIDTLHFLIFLMRLLMTAFANSHLAVLRQCNAAIASMSKINENLLSQLSRMAVLFLCIDI